MKLVEIFEGRSENRDLWDRIKSKGVVPSIDRERYTDMSDQGLEGPFRMKNGQVLYYDPKEGKYYNRDTDMYVDYDDYRKMDEQEAVTEMDSPGPNDDPWAKGAKATPIKADKAKKDFSKILQKSVNKHNKAKQDTDKKVAQHMKEQGVAEGDKRPGYVVKASDKPKTVKPNTGGSSKHPYQSKLVGESQWGQPKDVLAQVLQTLEKEVEWPLTDVMDPQQVKQLLSPLMQAVSQKLNSLDEAEVGNTDYQFAHGRTPKGHGSWFFVAHRGGVDFSKDVEGEDYIQLHQMSYSDAKKAAVKWAKSKGLSQIFVAT